MNIWVISVSVCSHYLNILVLKMHRDTWLLVNWGVSGVRGALNHFLYVMLLLYTSFLYTCSSKDKVLGHRRKKTFCFSGYQMSVFHSIMSLRDKFLCPCIQTSTPLVILPLVSGTVKSILMEKPGVCSLLEFRYFLRFSF